MLPLLTLLSPAKFKAAIIVAVILVLIGVGYYQGNRSAMVTAKEFELLAAECEKRAVERELEVTEDALKRQQYLLETERRLTERIEEEIRKNGVISKQLQEEIKKQKVVVRRVTQYVEKEIEKVIYRECVIPPSGVSTLNRAAREHNDSRFPSK